MHASNQSPRAQSTKDWTFYATLLIVSLLLLRLLLAYAAVLMFATVVVLVTWPIFARIRGWTGRPALAGVLTTGVLGTVVVLPVFFLSVAFVRQAVQLGQRGALFVQGGGITRSVDTLQLSWADHLPASLAGYLPDPVELTKLATAGLQTAALSSLQSMTAQVPDVVATTAGLSIDAFVFVFAVTTFYVKGPDVLVVVRDFIPLEERYLDALFEVFADLANRAVGGAVAVAVLQGALATLGYAIAGVHGLVFFGSLTALFALVPVVGGALVYLPLVVWTGVHHGVWWALFLLAWQVLLT